MKAIIVTENWYPLLVKLESAEELAYKEYVRLIREKTVTAAMQSKRRA